MRARAAWAALIGIFVFVVFYAVEVPVYLVKTAPERHFADNPGIINITDIADQKEGEDSLGYERIVFERRDSCSFPYELAHMQSGVCATESIAFIVGRDGRQLITALGQYGAIDGKNIGYGFATVYYSKINFDGLPVDYRRYDYSTYRNSGPVSGNELSVSKINAGEGSSLHAASGPPQSASERRNGNGSKRGEIKGFFDLNIEERKDAITGAMLLATIFGFLAYFIVTWDERNESDQKDRADT